MTGPIRLLLVGIAMWGGSAFLLRDGFTLLRRGEHVNASVLSVHRVRRGRSGRRTVAEVRTYGGTIEAVCRIEGDGLAPGMNVPMVYLPDHPTICRRDDLRAILGAPGVSFVLGAIVTIGSLAWYERERRRT